MLALGSRLRFRSRPAHQPRVPIPVRRVVARKSAVRRMLRRTDDGGDFVVSVVLPRRREGLASTGGAAGTDMGMGGVSPAVPVSIWAVQLLGCRGPHGMFDPESASATTAARAAGLRRGISASVGRGRGVVVHGSSASITSAGV